MTQHLVGIKQLNYGINNGDNLNHTVNDALDYSVSYAVPTS